MSKPKAITVGDEVLTKAELIRRTVALHPEWRPCDVISNIKLTHGIDVSSGGVSTIRNDYLRSKPKPHKAVGKPQTFVDAEVFISDQVKGFSALKEAVRLLGKDFVVAILEVMK